MFAMPVGETFPTPDAILAAADKFLADIATEPRGTRPTVTPLPTSDDWHWDDNELVTF